VTRDNELYKEARALANEAREKAGQMFREASKAYAKGQKEMAEQLTLEGHYWRQKARKEQKRGGHKIFAAKNAQIVNEHTIDLHGCHVEEALDQIDDTMHKLRTLLPCTWSLEIITGKGLHSEGKVARLRPAVRGFLNDTGLTYHENAGGFVVRLPPETAVRS
jgi:DNA-nicking Smr family endonuclease